MLILIKLIVAHIITDFILQPDHWIKERKKKRFRSKYLYLHGLATGLLAYLLVGEWKHVFVFFIIATSHIVIDAWKSYQKENLRYFLLDQLLHFLVILFVWDLLIGDYQVIINKINVVYQDKSFWAIVLGYLFIIWPVGYLVAFSTKQWKHEIKDEGLYDAGKRIGQLERVLILTFVLIGRYEAIGFLIAAKSVFRFNQIQEHKERKLGEYILIGTMLSFAIAIIIGITVKFLLGTKLIQV